MITLNNYFQEIHCINLKRRSDRWEECEEEFSKHNLQVNRFEAFDGNDIKKIPGFTPGQVGAIFSHRAVIEYAKEKKLDNILIFEDDVEFHEDFVNLFNEWSSEIPDDWDMILFGGNHSGNNPWSYGKLIKKTEHIYKVTHSLALHCYAVNSKIYDKLINELSKMNKTNDALVADVQRDINCYIIRPHIAWQRPSFSDLRELFVDMPFLYNDSDLYEGKYFGPEMLKRDDVRDKLTESERIRYDNEKKIYMESLND